MQPAKNDSLRSPIGILGGTFDPIHMGHLRMAIELYEACQLAKVHIMPCYQPVHRSMPVATPEQRLAMVERAIKNEPSLIADDREITRKGPSYTIDTLFELHTDMPHTPLCVLIGIDAFLGFASWHRFEEILREAHIIVAHRPPYHLPTSGIIADLLKEYLQEDTHYVHKHKAGGILLRPISLLEISATDIRNQIATTRNPRYLLPNSVYEYIKQYNIYCKKAD